MARKSKAEKRQAKLDKKEEKAVKKQAKQEASEKKSANMPSNKVEGRGKKRIIAIFTLVVLVFLLLLGVRSIITAEDSASVKRTINNTVESIEQGSTIKSKATVFAQNFVWDYYSYGGDSTAYTEQMRDYYADGVPITPPDQEAEVLICTAEKATLKNTNVDVDVCARIRYHIAGGGSSSTVEKTVTLRVPVKYEDGNYAVIAQPVYVATRNNSSNIAGLEVPSASSISGAEERKIRSLTNNFLKAYFGNSSSALQYYVTDDYGTPAAIGNGMTYDGEAEIIITTGANESYNVDVTFEVSDSGVIHTQHAILRVVQNSDGRYYVDKLSTH